MYGLLFLQLSTCLRCFRLWTFFAKKQVGLVAMNLIDITLTYVYIYIYIYVGRFWKFHSNVICIESMACNKAGVDRNEYKLHCTFPLALFDYFTCITDIGAHKPWLLAPFAMHDFPMYYIPNVANIFLICMFVMLYLYVLHGNKTYSLSLSLSTCCTQDNQQGCFMISSWFSLRCWRVVDEPLASCMCDGPILCLCFITIVGV